jgi:membrane associated rhomboid family serine protease
MGGESRPFSLRATFANMFPLRDTIRSRSFPTANYALIAINVLVFLFESSLNQRIFNQFVFNFGLVPARLSLSQPLTYFTFLTSAFMHGSWFHLISNMWTLFIFGDNVEDRMGHARYMAFYLLSAVLAGVVHVFFTPESRMPTIGASGALAGVLGAYFLLFPRARVVTFIPLFFLPWFIEIPAFIYLGVWFLSQLSSGLVSLGSVGGFNNIAWWAHIGGFVFGVVLVRLFTRRPRPSYPYEIIDEHGPFRPHGD